MSWYNPLNWFRKEVKQSNLDNKESLYCDNPQCKETILDSEIAYSPVDKEIYHPGECQNLAQCYKIMKFRDPNFVMMRTYEFISRDTALNLFRNGNLVQSKSLEDKVI